MGMVSAAAAGRGPRRTGFALTRNLFESLLTWLEGEQAAALSHAALEDRLAVDARELIRQAMQEHLDLRAESEPDLPGVLDVAQVPRPTIEPGHARALATVFGTVQVTRKAYRKRGLPNLHPADATLNLPAEKHSHGLRRLAAIESSRGSFDASVEAIERATGQDLGKRQVEELANRAAVDFDAYYLQRPAPPGPSGDVLVLSCDGKGVVMRPDAPRRAPGAHRRQSRGGDPEAGQPAVPGGETQPQTNGRVGCGLRRHPGRAQPERHHAHRR